MTNTQKINEKKKIGKKLILKKKLHFSCLPWPVLAFQAGLDPTPSQSTIINVSLGR